MISVQVKAKEDDTRKYRNQAGILFGGESGGASVQAVDEDRTGPVLIYWRLDHRPTCWISQCAAAPIECSSSPSVGSSGVMPDSYFCPFLSTKTATVSNNSDPSARA